MSLPTSQTTSFTLVFGAQAGTRDAIEAIFVLYFPLVYSWARKFGLQHTDAEDTAQEVLSQIERRLQSFQRKERKHHQFRTWLWTVTKNHSTDVLRRCGNRPVVSHDALRSIAEPPPSATSESPPQSMQRSTVEVFLGRLGELDRRVLEESIANGRIAKEIADELGISQANVYTRKCRAMRKIQAWVQELESDLSKLV
ncbi:MAG: sigma-70 family RNA polymerase sigma factor [Planctomycetales bacterium]|nr:sigma-70 family RNA polymerase sigma factor [Planctomycetales bacterium]